MTDNFTRWDRRPILDGYDIEARHGSVQRVSRGPSIQSIKGKGSSAMGGGSGHFGLPIIDPNENKPSILEPINEGQESWVESPEVDNGAVPEADSDDNTNETSSEHSSDDDEDKPLYGQE